MSKDFRSKSPRIFRNETEASLAWVGRFAPEEVISWNKPGPYHF